jgi:YVTN family beta-propeller protein
MNSKTLAMKSTAALGSAILVFLVGCGGNMSQPPLPSQPTAVIVSPSSATVQTGGVQQFTATVSPNGANQAVTWSLSGTGCTGASCGTIDATGKYTTPANVPNPPTVTVRATSVADLAKAAIAAVNIMTAANNSIPTVSDFSPRAAATGGPAFTLTVVGLNFVSSSVVRWNGSDRPTAFVNSTEVTAQIPAGDIAASGTATITVFNPEPGGGSSKGLGFIVGGVGPVSVAVAADPSGKFGKFVYVANDLSDNISMYSIDATTGVLTFIGEVGAGWYPSSVAVHPSGKFAYVANYGDGLAGIPGSVSMYRINADGGLAPTGTLAEAYVGTTSVAVHPSGKFAYVANARFSNTISTYTIDATTGALTSTGMIAGAIEGTTSVAVDPSGKFAYMTNGALLPGIPGSSNTVSMYLIDATTGALTSTGTIATGTLPKSVAVDPSGKFAYVANANSNNVSMYTIDATAGTLTSTGTIAAGTSPSSVAVDPSGKFAYVANANSNNVSMYAIDATAGTLTSTGTIAAGRAPSSVAVDPSGKFAYVSNNFSNSISVYAIDATTGALTLIGTVGT